MKLFLRKWLRPAIMAVLATTLLIAVFPVAPAVASISIAVSPSQVGATVIPGSSGTYNITINAGLPVDIEVVGLGETSAGAVIGIPAQNDITSFTSRSWVNLDKSHLERGNSQSLEITVNVPPGIASGEYYSAIYLQAQSSSQENVSVISGMLIPVILTVGNASTRNIAGQITRLDVSVNLQAQSIDILTTLNNLGNCRITNSSNKITIRDSAQNVIWQSEMPVMAPSVIPNFPRVIDVQCGMGLPDGYYSVTSDVAVSGRILCSKTVDLAVGVGAKCDLNGDHVCDSLDLKMVKSHMGETGTPGWIPEDLHQDGVINVQDLVEIGKYME
jgi:hypothetical protein